MRVPLLAGVLLAAVLLVAPGYNSDEPAGSPYDVPTGGDPANTGGDNTAGDQYQRPRRSYVPTEAKHSDDLLLSDCALPWHAVLLGIGGLTLQLAQFSGARSR